MQGCTCDRHSLQLPGYKYSTIKSDSSATDMSDAARVAGKHGQVDITMLETSEMICKLCLQSKAATPQ